MDAGRPVHTSQSRIINSIVYTTTEPKNIQALLATQFQDFSLGPARHGTFAPLLGNGIFSSDGKQWEFARALLRPQFGRDQVGDLELEESHVQNLMNALPVEPNTGGWTEQKDLVTLFYRLTFDSALEFLFGRGGETQLAALPGYVARSDGPVVTKSFSEDWDTSLDHLATAAKLNDLHWIHYIRNKDFYRRVKAIHEFCDYYVFLEALAEETQDPIMIRDQLLSILLAGRDTTAGLLSFLFNLLGQHPHIYQKLRTAIIDDFGTYKQDNQGVISFASLKACSYLQYCMMETLRLYPSVPFNGRRAVRDTTLPTGGGPDGRSPIFVPKGREVGYCVYLMQRRKDLWGEDADEFKPERWKNRKPGWEYLPFNGGPRICLGQQFALTEAGYVTVRLLQRFDMIDGSAVAGREILWYLNLTGRPFAGVPLRLHEADD
ncbi:cytochrome P450 [Rhizodiscina lignyota]|uniref:Cytochrome P450 n=1 Tax=Rhizodiscina lignyota TaxID=1504668 RepID=A0A9P4I9R9_9PEZI|nr:cytochrome P450 [Rhizodiscina lignyota]